MTRTPAYCRQKRNSGDLAYVKLDGKRRYLGAYGSEESRKEYERLVAERRANRARTQSVDDLTVVELLSYYVEHVRDYYRRPDGTPSKTQQNILDSMKPVRELYGHTRTADFGPRALKAVREHFIDSGACCSYVNDSVGRVKRMFKWAVSEELVEPNVFQRLQTVEGLKLGRSRARESKPVRPVPQGHIDSIESFVSRHVWAIIQLQLLTAARQGEIVIMRAVDIDMSGKIWTYTPETHKTAQHGHERTIYLGPQAQSIVRGYLDDRPLDTYLFSPREAESERMARIHAERTPPPNARSSHRPPAASWHSRASAGSTIGTLALREVLIEANNTIEPRFEVPSAIGIPDPIASVPNQNHHLRPPWASNFAMSRPRSCPRSPGWTFRHGQPA